MYSCDELLMCSLECYFGVYFPRCCATREINTKITLLWAHKQFATRVPTLFYIHLLGMLRSLFTLTVSLVRSQGIPLMTSWKEDLNPLRAKFFRGNINIYLYFVSFLHIDTTQVVEILPHIIQEHTYSTKSISWLLMSWRRKEPGHQTPWYWRS